MEVIYNAVNAKYAGDISLGEDDMIELLENNWDDYGYKTSFPTRCRIKGEVVDLGSIRILVEGVNTTSEYLAQAKAGGWNGVFPILNCVYVSVPDDITFYEQIKARLGIVTAIAIAECLNDASYLARIKQDDDAMSLIATSGFKDSLQRERGSKKSFIDGWKIFSSNTDTSVDDFKFSFQDCFGYNAELKLKFGAKEILPHDINVLIGANGIGKSQLLQKIVNAWISDSKHDDSKSLKDEGFSRNHNISQVVVVSYSPFERFPLDLEHTNLKDKSIYRYFGFRERAQSMKGSDKVILTYEAPKKNAAHSLLLCVKDDIRFYALPDWGKKVQTLFSVLNSAFVFDYAAICVDKNINVDRFFKWNDPNQSVVFDYKDDENIDRYFQINPKQLMNLNIEELSQACIYTKGVSFFSNGNKVQLSSGQRLFSFIVANMLGAIRRDSLLLIDEPELFLHPNLEVLFIQMLKDILISFNSKALIATHSSVTVREMPSDCVHVMRKGELGLDISQPPFQTFGGDIQRIASYVFGDNAISKPFEDWVNKKVEEYDSPESLIELLHGKLNEELIIQIRFAFKERKKKNPLWL